MLVLQQKLNRRVHVYNSDVSTRRFAKTCICQSHELRRQRSSRALPHTACCHRLGAPKVAKHRLPSSSDVTTRRFAKTCVCQNHALWRRRSSRALPHTACCPEAAKHLLPSFLAQPALPTPGSHTSLLACVLTLHNRLYVTKTSSAQISDVLIVLEQDHFYSGSKPFTCTHVALSICDDVDFVAGITMWSTPT